MTIDVEVRLTGLFALLPERQTGFKPVFHFGDEVELNKFLLKSTKSVYPLIYKTSIEEKHDQLKGLVTTNLEIFIATRNLNTDMFNTERWETSYKTVLKPLFDDIDTVFQKSGIILSAFAYDIKKRPNYSQLESGKEGDNNKTLDIIDAMVIRLPIVMNSNCINDNIRF